MERGHAAGYRERAADSGTTSRSSPWPTSPKSAARSRGRTFRTRASTPTTRAARGRARRPGLRRHRDAAERARRRRARRPRARSARPVREAPRDVDRRGARHAPPRRPRPSASSIPATTTSTRRSIKTVRGVLDARAHRQGAPRDAADLPQHARQGRDRVAHRLAARAALLGRRHRHGPRQPHLLPGVRVAQGVPDGHHGAGRDAGPVRHRGRLHLQPEVPHGRRVGAPVVERGRAQGALHDPRRARAPCASRTTPSRSRRRTRAPTARSTWKFEREAISSDWMDSSHVTWFNSLFDDFKGAIARARVRRARRRGSRSSACSSSPRPTRRRATAAASCRCSASRRSRATTSRDRARAQGTRRPRPGRRSVTGATAPPGRPLRRRRDGPAGRGRRSSYGARSAAVGRATRAPTPTAAACS